MRQFWDRSIFVGIVTLVSGAGFAQPTGKPVRPPEILDLIGYAQAAPPEFAADALIRIADSDKIADNAWKRELLEQALALAPAAQYKVKRPNSAAGGDNHWGYFSFAYEMEMDTLSLQWRAIQALSKTDPARARELFSQIPPPRLDPLTCQDGLVYDVEPFYQALAEIAKDQKVEFIEPYVQHINSHTQVAPVIDMILHRKAPPREFERLTAELSAALGQIDHDPRSLSVMSTLPRVNALATALQAAGLPPAGFLTAYQNYLQAHWNARQCKGSETGTFNPAISMRRYFVPKDSTYLSGVIDILGNQDRQVEFDDGQPDNDPFWATPESAKLLKDVMALRNNASGKPASDADKKGIEWQTALTNFRNAVDEWKVEAEKTPENYFYEKCTLLTALLEAVPRSDTELRANVVQAFTIFLTGSAMRTASRIEWWRQARGLLENAPEAPAAFARSQDPVMFLYVQLERTLNKKTP
jgi:hypothetical protein